MTKPPLSRYAQALILATEAHDGQIRKGSGTPYITHPVAVSRLVAGLGGDEDQQIAALLHDVLEDRGEAYAKTILETLGPEVLRIVRACTDGVPDARGKKEPWGDRKLKYLVKLPDVDERALLVIGADKLDNARSIREDLNTVGLKVFDRFSVRKDATLWYYRSLADTFSSLNSPVATDLATIVEEIESVTASLEQIQASSQSMRS